MATRVQQIALLAQIIDDATDARYGLIKAARSKIQDDVNPNYEVNVLPGNIVDWLGKVDARIATVKTNAALL